MGAMVSKCWFSIMQFIGWWPSAPGESCDSLPSDAGPSVDGVTSLRRRARTTTSGQRSSDNDSASSHKSEHPKPSLDTVPPNKKSKINEDPEAEEMHFESVPNMHFGNEECPESLLPVLEPSHGDQVLAVSPNECGAKDLDLVEEGENLEMDELEQPPQVGEDRSFGETKREECVSELEGDQATKEVEEAGEFPDIEAEEMEILDDYDCEKLCMNSVKSESDGPLSNKKQVKSGDFASLVEVTGMDATQMEVTPTDLGNPVVDESGPITDDVQAENDTYLRNSAVSFSNGKGQVCASQTLGSKIRGNFARDHGDPLVELGDGTACSKDAAEKFEAGKVDTENAVDPSEALPVLLDFEDKDTENIDPNIIEKASAQNPNLKTMNIQWTGEAASVMITGSWLNWATQIPLENFQENIWSANIEFEDDVKEIELKFIVDGVWLTSTEIPTVSDGKGNINNIIKLVY